MSVLLSNGRLIINSVILLSFILLVIIILDTTKIIKKEKTFKMAITSKFKIILMVVIVFDLGFVLFFFQPYEIQFDDLSNYQIDFEYKDQTIMGTEEGIELNDADQQMILSYLEGMTLKRTILGSITHSGERGEYFIVVSDMTTHKIIYQIFIQPEQVLFGNDQTNVVSRVLENNPYDKILEMIKKYI